MAGQSRKEPPSFPQVFRIPGSASRVWLPGSLRMPAESFRQVTCARTSFSARFACNGMSGSSGYSWSMNVYCPALGVGPASPADNEYRPGFAAELMHKHLRLSQQAARDAGTDTRIGHLATDVFERFVEEEDGTGMDCSAILRRIEANLGSGSQE